MNDACNRCGHLITGHLRIWAPNSFGCEECKCVIASKERFTKSLKTEPAHD